MLPDLRQTGSRTRPHRIFTAEHAAYETVRPYGSTVAMGGWTVGYDYEVGSPETTLSVHRLTLPDLDRRTPLRIEEHPLSGTEYPSMDAAREAAYAAGLTGVMVYEDRRPAHLTDHPTATAA